MPTGRVEGPCRIQEAASKGGYAQGNRYTTAKQYPHKIVSRTGDPRARHDLGMSENCPTELRKETAIA